MTRMTGPDCVVMCNLINTYIHTYIHTCIQPALRFRPRAVVAGRGVVAVCTRISSQEHVYDKLPPGGLHAVA